MGDRARTSLYARLRTALRGQSRSGAPTPFAPTDPRPSWENFASAAGEAGAEVHGPVPRGALRAELGRVTGSRELHCAHGAAALLDDEPVGAAHDAICELPWLVATGFAAVARSGAVAVTQNEVPARLHLLLPERLVLLVPARALVMDLPDLYAIIDARALSGGYLTLIGGPSRTADIEQQLVTGAHGPRALVVIPWEDA